MKRPDSALVALAVGALGSGAANVAWTWQHGPVRIIAGLFATALVPISLHLWPRVPITGRWTRVIRAVVMTYICAAAAVVNLSHAVWLLVDHSNPVAENVVLAVLLISAIEAVMVMASLARRAPAVTVSRSAPKPKPRRETVPSAPAVAAPAPEPTPLHEVGRPPSVSAQVREWLAAEYAAGRTPTGAEADEHFGLKGGARCGARALARVLTDRERQAV